FFFQAEDGIRDRNVTGVQTCALPIFPNDNGQLRPGLFVEGKVVLEEVPVPVAVKASALQTVDEKPVVFIEVAKSFEVREVEPGRSEERREGKSVDMGGRSSMKKDINT